MTTNLTDTAAHDPAAPDAPGSVARAIRLISTGAQSGEACGDDLAAPTWTFDALPGYGPGASVADAIPGGAPRQGPIPAEYREASDAELEARIEAARATLGDRLVILGHFYQRDEVVRHADYVGDSFQLANAALEHPNAEAIVFDRATLRGLPVGLQLRQVQQQVLRPEPGRGAIGQAPPLQQQPAGQPAAGDRQQQQASQRQCQAQRGVHMGDSGMRWQARRGWCRLSGIGASSS